MKHIQLLVAGIPVKIHCSLNTCLEQLKNRYDDFLDAQDPSPYDVFIHIDLEAPPHNHNSPTSSFETDRVNFELPGYVGVIDPATSANLTISSDHPINGIDYFLRVVYALLSFRKGGLMLHGAGIVRKDRAFVFFGHSGSGKTTVTRNSSNDLVLNDDLIILLPKYGTWDAYGTPFTNPTQTHPSNGHAPVAALLRLVQNTEVFVAPLQGAEALAELISSIPVLNGSATPPLARCRQILKAIPTYKLHLLPDPSFWPVIENL